jgi:cytochrome c oxidase subunit IV
MADATHDWAHHKKIYTIIGVLLFICTGLTLALGLWAPLDVGPPGPTPGDYVIGLALAGTKASLVAVIFMHLNHEKGLIYKTLVFTFLFFVALMALTLFAGFDPIREEYDTLETTNGKLIQSIDQ